MSPLEREVFEGDANVVAAPLNQVMHVRVRPGAMATFEVGEFDNCYGRVR